MRSRAHACMRKRESRGYPEQSGLEPCKDRADSSASLDMARANRSDAKLRSWIADRVGGLMLVLTPKQSVSTS